MRAFLAAVAVFASFSSAAIAGPKEEALQVLDKWTKAFSDSDVDGIVKLYAPDALFVGTSSKTVVVNPEGIREYFEAALLTNKPRGATLNNYDAMILSDTAVVITGLEGSRQNARRADVPGTGDASRHGGCRLLADRGRPAPPGDGDLQAYRRCECV
jgi:uncharacterized protein (TIGR02246 family)